MNDAVHGRRGNANTVICSAAPQGFYTLGIGLMQRKDFVIQRPAPIPIRETRYGFLYVETADVYSDGRRENVKRTPFWKLLDDDEEDDEDDDERQAERKSVYRRDYTVNHRPQ